MNKTLVISMHPAPYRDEVYKYLKKNLGYNFDIIYLFDKDKGHKEWNLKTEIESVKAITIFGRIIHIGLWNIVKKYDVLLIPGWYPISLLYILIRLVVLGNKKVVFACDTIFTKDDVCHKIIFKVLKKCNSFFVPGKRSKTFLSKKLEIPESKIFEGYYMINQTEWHNSISINDDIKMKERRLLKINNDDFICLFVGKFVENRNIPLLINVLKCLRKKNNKIRFLIIGDGEYYKELVEEQINEDKNSIIYFSSVEYEKLAMFYSISDCYFHPGSEPYSLATVQAVIAELPIVSNLNVGAIDDYIVPKRNGIIINSENPVDYQNAILDIYNNYSNYKLESKKLAQYYLDNRNVDFAAKQLKRAFE